MTDWVNETHVGDCRDLLGQMVSDGVRVQTCITSPPYYGLRDYGTATWEGGLRSCNHHERRGGDGSKSAMQVSSAGTQQYQYRQTCRKCGARRVDRQIGLEPTPSEYVTELVTVFRLVRRLLGPDGTLWLNLGDTFAARGAPGGSNLAKLGERFSGGGHKHDTIEKPPRHIAEGSKPKDLLGIPWRVALALQADGWYLRSDIIEEVELYCPCGCGYVLDERIWRWAQDREIIWKKPNAMPESTRDRPTRCHEYLFLLSKSKAYYFDAAAIREPATSGPSDVKKMRQGLPRLGGKHKASVDAYLSASSATNIGRKRAVGDGCWRNKRSVWTVATTPFSGAHFATFPRKLIEPCVLAGSRPGDIVLDPFMGAGTTAATAMQLQRRFIGCELQPAYLRFHKDRQHAVRRAD